jgi:hypothetical protein
MSGGVRAGRLGRPPNPAVPDCQRSATQALSEGRLTRFVDDASQRPRASFQETLFTETFWKDRATKTLTDAGLLLYNAAGRSTGGKPWKTD